MRVIIDFDYTIFDTEAFRVSLIEAFTSFGVTDALYRSTEEQLIHADGLGIYDFTKHLNLLHQQTDASIIELNAAAEGVFQQMRSFLFSDALTFLQHTAEQKHILSYGQQAWQQRKIQYSGIEQWVHSVTITNGKPKEECIESLITQERTIFIDDRGSAIDAIKAHFPEVFCIWLHRPGTPYYDERCISADSTASELSTNLLT